jgi:hypothetical protein
MGYRAGWLTVGIVVHGSSPLPGHGPGITAILTGPASRLVAEADGAGHRGLTEAGLGYSDHYGGNGGPGGGNA